MLSPETMRKLYLSKKFPHQKKKKGKYIKNVLATQKHSSARKALFVDDIEHTICLMDILKYLQQQHL